MSSSAAYGGIKVAKTHAKGEPRKWDADGNPIKWHPLCGGSASKIFTISERKVTCIRCNAKLAKAEHELLYNEDGVAQFHTDGTPLYAP